VNLISCMLEYIVILRDLSGFCVKVILRIY
jgi:hypothetical protein